MLVSSLLLGIRGLKKGYAGVLSNSLMVAGLSMAAFGIWENMYPICVFGFLFFAMLPFANNCLDYLVRTNIPDELQGRAWGFIGFLSQIGYVVAYGTAGALADLLGRRSGLGVGRGAAFVVMGAGVLLAVMAFAIRFIRWIRDLEKGVEY